MVPTNNRVIEGVTIESNVHISIKIIDIFKKINIRDVTKHRICILI